MNNDTRKHLGNLLKSERERKNIALDNLAEQLKISESNLESIENGDTASLPSELYFGLFAKSYAEAIGIDYENTVEAIKAELENQTKVEEPAKDNIKKAKAKKPATPEDDSKKLIKKLGYIFGGIAALFLIFLLVNMFFFKDENAAANQDLNNEETTGANEEKLEVNAETANYNWDQVNYPENDKLKLTIIPKRESWSTILADGDTVIYKTLYPGRTYSVDAEYRMLVSIGIPSAVDVQLNGKDVDLSDPETRRISRVAIDQMNFNRFFEPKEERKFSEPQVKATQENKVENDAKPSESETDNVPDNDLDTPKDTTN